ncbi:MAG: Cof-type HAD-IIB family hydrolase [Synergistetes bacterium]|nr:Cof-type HAD-IIB family hydrolase [Synergistota bacterium]MCX8128208.1 Cof-type HAD-IIB family hydrolase [Synergistota bacterium]MDW8192655.1 HAD family hydrolase [Synergistota bacterium]
MWKNKIKLIVVDLDGTLLSREGDIEPHVVEEFRRVRNLGIRIVVATGRLTMAARDFAKKIGSDLPIISCNGALIESLNGDIIFTIPLDKKAILEVLRLLHLIPGFSPHFFTPHRMLALRMSEVLKFYMNYVKEEVMVAKNLSEIFKEKLILKILLLAETSKLVDRYLAFFKNYLNGKAYVARSFPTYIEVVNPKANKGVALEKLLERLEYDLSEVMAFGDSENDIEVFKRVGLAIAVSNADPNLKKYAHYITKAPLGDGVVEALRFFLR